MGNTCHPKRHGFSRESVEAEDCSALSFPLPAAAGANFGTGSKPGGGRTGEASLSLDESCRRRRGLPRPTPPPAPPPAAPALFERVRPPPLRRPALLLAAAAAAAFHRPPTAPALRGRPRERFAGGAAVDSSRTASTGSDFTMLMLRGKRWKKTRWKQGGASEEERRKPLGYIAEAREATWETQPSPTIPRPARGGETQTTGRSSYCNQPHAREPKSQAKAKATRVRHANRGGEAIPGGCAVGKPATSTRTKSESPEVTDSGAATPSADRKSVV